MERLPTSNASTHVPAPTNRDGVKGFTFGHPKGRRPPRAARHVPYDDFSDENSKENFVGYQGDRKKENRERREEGERSSSPWNRRSPSLLLAIPAIRVVAVVERGRQRRDRVAVAVVSVAVDSNLRGRRCRCPRRINASTSQTTAKKVPAAAVPKTTALLTKPPKAPLPAGGVGSAAGGVIDSVPGGGAGGEEMPGPGAGAAEVVGDGVGALVGDGVGEGVGVGVGVAVGVGVGVAVGDGVGATGAGVGGVGVGVGAAPGA
ncbi:hypothetical protein LWI28_028872 [Acer negundo]|uniref:Uncharacterized protein n=1 Tax=Acer negundo TaxID=4023 RepID=A0AAD5IKZ2_ACENE|nr:hypothetical protein LWI28_028872 [Acer negundo]